ncbi:ComF family protein [Euzebya sp.]|uniref:ComF family protein n=1 Tax=Euzebya sp. TaxID=1971409 RepID=UPI0035160B47
MRALVDLLLPPRCLACRWCGAEPLCDRCGQALVTDEVRHHLDDGIRAVAAYAYGPPLSTAIKRVKTDALRAGARGLATLLTPHLPDGVPRTWVPATRRRRRRRGLDLPEVLAGRDAVPLLRAVGDRADHGTMAAADRRRVTADAYEVTTRPPAAVVLVDDVRATGATLLAAAQALRRDGARRVLCVTLAASPGPPSAARRRAPGDPGRGSSAASGRSS